MCRRRWCRGAPGLPTGACWSSPPWNRSDGIARRGASAPRSRGRARRGRSPRCARREGGWAGRGCCSSCTSPWHPRDVRRARRDRTGGAIRRLEKVLRGAGRARRRDYAQPRRGRRPERFCVLVARRGSAREPREGGAVVDESGDARRVVPRKAGDGCRTRRVSIPERTPAPEARKVVPTHFIKERQRFSVCKQSGYFVDAFIRIPVRVGYSSATPLKTTPINLPRLSRKLTPSNFAPSNFGIAFLRRARRPLARRASRALAATFRARRRASRTRRTHAHDPCAESRTPDTTAGTPSVKTPLLPPMSAPVESAEAHAGDDDDESLTARCARWMAHTAAATTTDPCPCSADPDEPGQVRAPPLYSVVWQEKISLFHVLNTFSRESDREERLGPKLPRIPAGSVRPGISALLVKVSRPTPSPAPFPDPPLLTSHPPSPEPPRSRLDAPTSTTTYPTIAKTPIRCGGSWRSRCGRWP